MEAALAAAERAEAAAAGATYYIAALDVNRRCPLFEYIQVGPSAASWHRWMQAAPHAHSLRWLARVALSSSAATSGSLQSAPHRPLLAAIAGGLRRLCAAPAPQEPAPGAV